jgi:hypothetical protein
MLPDELFDVIISVSGDPVTRHAFYEVTVIDKYNFPGGEIGRKADMTSLDDAMEFAKGCVTAFLQGTEARDDRS